MKTRTVVLLLAALILVPLITTSVVLYAGSSTPIGTFRIIEKKKPAKPKTKSEAPPQQQPAHSEGDGTITVQSGTANADIVIKPVIEDHQRNITQINSNGRVRVNNLA